MNHESEVITVRSPGLGILPDFPGLVSWKAVEIVGDSVTVEEVWDVTVSGCPVIPIDLKTGERIPHAISVTRYVRMKKPEWDAINYRNGDRVR